MSDSPDTRNRRLADRLLGALPAGAIEATARLPSQIAGYTVLQRLGAGGTGVVLRAERDGRVVALKLLKDGEVADAAQRRRFFREARALQQIDHPNVVDVLEVGEANGVCFMALHFVQGGSLQSWVDREGPLDSARVARLGVQLASGLAAAHREGAVHRDVKPSNVLLTTGGAPVLCDFGLVKQDDRLGVTQQLSRSGAVLGTPGFLSPEQAQGEGSAGPLADIYGLGATLYYLLTGAPPIQGTDWTAVVLATVCATPKPITELRPDVAPRLARIIERCLEKEPARRWPSAEALEAALRDYLAAPPFVTAASRAPWLLALAVAAAGGAALSLFAAGPNETAGRQQTQRPESPSPPSEPEQLRPSSLTQPESPPPQGEPEQPYLADQAANWVAEGQRAFAAGRREEAIRALDRAIALDPDQPQAYRWRGRVRGRLGQHQAALEDFTRCSTLVPEDPDLLFWRSLSLRELGRHDEALADLQRAVEIAPDLGVSWAHLGAELLTLQRAPDALAAFDRALELRPRYLFAWRNRGWCYATLGRHAEAIADFDRVLQVEPRDAIALSRRGGSKAALGRHDAALVDFGRALALDGSRVSALVGRARCWLALGESAKAAADIARAHQLAPDSARVYLERARLHERQARPDEAAADLAKAESLGLDERLQADARELRDRLSPGRISPAGDR
jgi:serine/threonine protein kinase